MTTIENELFANLPRRRRLGGAVTIAVWLLLCVAFVTDAVPTRSSEDWLYEVEARRDAHARALAARNVAPDRRASLAPNEVLGALAPAAPAVLASAAVPAGERCARR